MPLSPRFAQISNLCLSLLFLAGCQTVPVKVDREPVRPDVPAAVERVSPPAEQLLVVVGEGPGATRARLFTLEREKDQWKVASGPIPASVGRNGFAPPGEKREGDGRTPSGLFPLEFVFGYAPEPVGKMPYRQATEKDLWVDDVNSPDYNTWVRRGETAAASFEEMRLPDRRYRHGVVIGYNRDPIVKGLGSAIFLHAWLEEGRPTAGCVALDEEQLVRVIKWLDPAKKPEILMGNPSDLETAIRSLPIDRH